MDDWAGLIVMCVLLFFAGVVAGMYLSEDVYVEEGAIAATIGKIECSLITNPDRTTAWKCEEVEGE